MKRNYAAALALAGLTLLLSTGKAAAQAAIGATTPHASAMLDITATGKGLLIPRMTQAQRPSGTVAPGLLIYQTDNTPGFYYYNGSAWVALAGGGGAAATRDSIHLVTVAVAPYNSNTAQPPYLGPYYIAPFGAYNGSINTNSTLPTQTSLFTPTAGYVVPRSATFSRFSVVALTAGSGLTTGTPPAITLTLYKNGTATPMTLSFTSPLAYGSILDLSYSASTVSVAPGDVLSYRYTQSNQNANVMYTITLDGI